MRGLESYKEWCKENAGKYWIADEPCDIKFATEPWEGQFSYTSTGEFVQYRNGTWIPARQAGC